MLPVEGARGVWSGADHCADSELLLAHLHRPPRYPKLFLLPQVRVTVRELHRDCGLC